MTKKNLPLLLVDVSNTWTKLAISHSDKIGKPYRIPTRELSIESLKTFWGKHPSKVFVASVVPVLNRLFTEVFDKEDVHFIDHLSPLGITISYPKPSSIGADRLANAVACAHFYDLPAIVIDFGTAVTFDIISKKREYLGGVIAPGLSAMTDYLHEKTALLPKIKIEEPVRAIGKSTKEAMLSGAVIGYRGLIREVIHEIKRELGEKKITLVATGGQAKIIARQMPEIYEVNDTLTLAGLHQIAKKILA